METKRKSLKYCCVCKGTFRCKVIDGRTVSLHRFPKNKRVKRVWIQRCKTVMKSFQWNENKLLCSEYFVDRAGPSMLHTLPSRFPTASGTDKIFLSSALDENEQEPDTYDGDVNFQGKPFIATRLESESETSEDLQMPATEVGDHQNGDNAETSFIQESHKSNLDVSLNFHDYTCEPVPASAIRMIETQTCIPTMTIGTQTESVQTFRSICTQTDTCEQRGIGVQATLPTLVYEDVMDNPSKLNSYTGIPTKGLFYLTKWAICRKNLKLDVGSQVVVDLGL